MTDNKETLIERLLNEDHNWHSAACAKAATQLQTLAARVKVLEAALSEHGGRYWEARYRDEGNENVELLEALSWAKED